MDTPTAFASTSVSASTSTSTSTPTATATPTATFTTTPTAIPAATPTSALAFTHESAQSRHAARAPVFQGIWIPLVTPFRDGDVDLPALRALVNRYRAAGVHGLVACGTSGEAAALDADEQLLVLDTILAEADGLPVAMGLVGNHLRQAVARVRQLGERPLAGLLASAPGYVRPAQDGLRLWFETLADASSIPLALYDIPYRTGVSLDIDTLLALAGHSNIVAVKDCGGSPEKTIALIADGRLAVMAGEDLQALSTLTLGGAGAIAASAHVRPDLYVAMFDAARAGAWDRARELFHALAPVIRLLYMHPNPGPVKAMLAMLHGCQDTLRPPMTAPDAELRAALAAAVAALPPAVK